MNQITFTISTALVLLAACKGSASNADGGSTKVDEVAPPPSNVPEKLDNPSLTSKGMTVNGFKAEQIECVGSGGFKAFFGEMGGLATQQSSMRSCVTETMKPRVHWTIKASAVSDVRVAGVSTPKVARCIADAIARVKLPDFDATCIATVVLEPLGK